jgi:hypothetical protein
MEEELLQPLLQWNCIWTCNKTPELHNGHPYRKPEPNLVHFCRKIITQYVMKIPGGHIPLSQGKGEWTRSLLVQKSDMGHNP